MGSCGWRVWAEKWVGPTSVRQPGTTALTSDLERPRCSSTCSVSITIQYWSVCLNACVHRSQWAKQGWHTCLVLLSGRADLSYWAEQTHLFCQGTFEQFVFNWSGYTGKRAGYCMESMLQVEGRGVCVGIQKLSISLSVDECRTAALPGVCVHNICKIPLEYVSKFIK